MTGEILDLDEEIKKDSRKYLRTETSLIAKYNVITRDEYERKKKLYAISRATALSSIPPYEGHLDHATKIILEYIERLEQKIDRLGTLLISGEFHKYDYTGEVVNISGGGLRLVSHLNLNRGSYVDMCIFFPPAFNNPFFVIGEVRKIKWSGKTGPDGKNLYYLGIKFVAIDEKDRETLIRYIFQTERQKLREAHECEKEETEGLV